MPKRPNFTRFIATGAILGFLVGAWIAWSGVLEKPAAMPQGYTYGVSDGIGIVGMLGGAAFGLGWMLFHLLVIPLQAFIFMMLSIVYLSLSEDSH